MRAVHVTPITPARHLSSLAGRSFCVSYAHPEQLHQVGPLVPEQGILLLDNGAFTTWRQGKQFDEAGFWSWANEAQEIYPQAVAVIPDVIDGTEEENWVAAARAIRGGLAEFPERTMFCWHTNDSLEQLTKACLLFNFLAIGSCQEHDIQTRYQAFLERIREANAQIEYVDTFYGRRPWVHVMRGLGKAHDFIRFDSADSSNLARNHWRYKGQPGHVQLMADRIEAKATRKLL